MSVPLASATHPAAQRTGTPAQPLHQAQGQNNVLTRRRLTERATRTLLIDNYDSYTYNLYQLLADVNRVAPVVIRNDELRWRELVQRLARGHFDSVVISPGPGTPSKQSDAGVCNALLEEADTMPILGVCFGMQALAHVHGAAVVRAPEAVHGRLSEIEHSGHDLFAGIPSGTGSGFDVVRYHSLAVDEATLPACLQPIAWASGAHHAVHLPAEDSEASRLEGGPSPRPLLAHGSTRGLLMALAHSQRPHFGVQFHPESVATRHGRTLLQNFRDVSCRHRELRDRSSAGAVLMSPPVPAAGAEPVQPPAVEPPANLDVRWRVIRGAAEELGGAETMFWHLHGSQDAADTFWLDSASQSGQRFSYFGGRGGPLWERLTFRLAEPAAGALRPGTVTVEDASGARTTSETHFLDLLAARLARWRCAAAADLPFDFTGGFVGYLGYELKAECGAAAGRASQHPDAAMFLTDRLVAVDHAGGDVYLVALHAPAERASVAAADAWLHETSDQLSSLRETALKGALEGAPNSSVHSSGTDGSDASTSGRPAAHGGAWEEALPELGAWEARRGRAGYTADVAACLEALRAGDSYELCLTTQLRRRGRIDPRALYMRLRSANPAAHAAWLCFGQDLPTICCSSPERFLRGTRDGIVEARPIKGTAARSPDPECDAARRAALLSCEKSRAENLMIVDLLRNDLGRICQVGSVHVSKLMEVESYATVHNLVSTVRGVRRPGLSAVDCIRAVFPGGSMTGAPKLRSMQILDGLENGSRGVYSGSLGFIGLNDTFDLNIVIRTAVVTADSVTIGAGGAVVLQSSPEGEYEEMRLKARALIAATEACAAE